LFVTAIALTAACAGRWVRYFLKKNKQTNKQRRVSEPTKLGR
jgi:hypothetical protein